jgi:Domain of unknown function (DUF4382)
MVKRFGALSLALAGACAAVGCGSSTSSPTSPTGESGSGVLYVVVGDSPSCDVLGLNLDAGQLVLNVAGSSNTVTFLNTNSLIEFDLAALRDSETLLVSNAVQAGNYDRFSLALTALTMYAYDGSKSPPFDTLTENLTTGFRPVQYGISPALHVGSSGIAALSLDFDLEHAVQVDAQGKITGFIDPVATATAPARSTANGFGNMDGLEGFVTTVQPTGFVSGTTTFTGGVAMQLLDNTAGVAHGPAVSVEFTTNTTACMEPVPPAVPQSNQPCASIPLNTVLTNSYVTADAFLDRNGNLTASNITIGPREDPAINLVAFVGTVLSVTRGPDGTVSSFVMFMRNSQPPAPGVSFDRAVVVNVPPSAIYNTYPPAPPNGATSPSTNFPALPFGASAIAPGEDVVVHGVFKLPASTSAPYPADQVSMTANEIDLTLQTHGGTFGSLLAVQPDDTTGAFTLSPCATLIQQGDSTALPIYVFTSAATSFVNVAGLTGLRSQPSIFVRGLLFYETQSVTINGVTVPAGKLVMLAKQVRQNS